MSRILAVGDIHGCAKTFKKLLTEKLLIQKSDVIYCIGDYIDRGPDSKGVIDFILQLRSENYRVHTLRGNHEQMLLDSMENEDEAELWIANGGNTTLQSFGVESATELAPVYLTFFRETKLWIETPDSIFVHAGLNFSLPDPFADLDAMLWIRNFTIDKGKSGGRVLIHGHTPQPASFIYSQQLEDAVNIDGGCVYKHRGMGNLFAINLTETELIAVRNCDI